MPDISAVQVWAPGRVNLIGDHTDYNDGWVLPLAIERGTSVQARRRPDQRLETTTRRPALNHDSVLLTELQPPEQVSWASYVQGVAWTLRQHNLPVGGAELLIDGDLPLSSGLSSSASLEVGVALALLSLYGQSLPVSQLALLAQQAEREFVGVNCGIMDQLAIAAGQPDHALLIDCRSLAIRAVPLPTTVSVLIVDSGAPRTLAGSAYNQRRSECAAAVLALQQLDPAIASLRDATPALLAAAQAAGVLSGLLLARARHVVTENARVLAAASALEAGDADRVGALMNESHASLRDDYAVSSPALDTLTSLLRALPGVHGARLSGAGFGGCCVALVAASAASAVAKAIGPAYTTATGNPSQVIISRAMAGAHVVG